MAGAQLLEAGVAADLEAAAKAHAAVGQALGAALDHFLLELEAGDAVDQQPTGPVVTVVDGDLIAAAAQMVGGAEARRARADDPHRLGQLLWGLQRRDPALLPGLVGQVLLDRADGDGAVAGLFDHAVAFAEAVLRTDAAADLRHGAGGLGEVVGFPDAALGGHPQPVGDVVVERAMRLAERHAALRAARGLFGGLGVDEVGVDLVEVLGAGLHVALGGRAALDLHEFEHALGHWPAALSTPGFGNRPALTPALHEGKDERP